jgi:6-phosphogluconolactonase
MNGLEVLTFGREKEMADFFIGRWTKISQAALGEKESFTVAVSGGNTPIYLYRRMAARKENLPWEKTHLFMADERFVPFCNPDSNFQMVKITLLNQLSIPAQNVHPIPVEEASPQIAAEKYEEDLRKFVKPAGGFPELDLILLGIGEDGHTASLFPGGPGFETTDFAAVVPLGEEKHDRITMTLPLINQAKNVIFYVCGRSKAAAVKRVLEERDPALPASRVQPRKGKLLFLLDLEASSGLSSPLRLNRPEPV